MEAIWIIATLLPLMSAVFVYVVTVVLGVPLGRLPAFLATAAIAGSCALSTIGLLNYVIFDRPEALTSRDHGHGHEDHVAGEHGAEVHGQEPEAHGHTPASPILVRGGFYWAAVTAEARNSETVQPDPASGPLGLRIGYHIDNVTVLMFFMVTLIATCIHVYSLGYMSHEPRFGRFFAYLSLFCFSMLALLISDNFFQIFMCWELVGVCSYFLIGFYYEKRSASNAANKAFITNRVGDVGFIVGLMVLFAHFGNFDFAYLFTDDGNFNPALKSQISNFWLTVAGIGIFVGCVGKSAQFPLHVWLPDAMEGPTPVSALIHAATMVAAGVYLVARSFPLFTPEALLVITYVGGITLFVAASIAVVATDIKKALAYSTVSQLGYMMFALGIGGWVAGLMHLVTHAFFKALLFLCSGSVIHGTGTQEMPEMGGLFKKMPITAIAMLIGVLAISGAPFLSGFYSKDLIIAHVLAYGADNPQHVVVLMLPIITAGVTTFYMFRLWFMTFTGTPRDAHVYDHAHESPIVMWGPLAILSVFAVFGAGLPFWPALENLLSYSQPAAVNPDYIHHVHEMHGLATLVASGTALLGLGLAAAVYLFNVLDANDARRQFANIYRLLANKWYFDELYRYLFVRPALIFSGWITAVDRYVVDAFVNFVGRQTVNFSRLDGKFDLGIVDGLVNLVADAMFHGGISLRRLQTGWLRGYVMLIAVGSVFLFTLGAVLYR